MRSEENLEGRVPPPSGWATETGVENKIDSLERKPPMWHASGSDGGKGDSSSSISAAANKEESLAGPTNGAAQLHPVRLGHPAKRQDVERVESWVILPELGDPVRSTRRRSPNHLLRLASPTLRQVGRGRGEGNLTSLSARLQRGREGGREGGRQRGKRGVGLRNPSA